MTSISSELRLNIEKFLLGISDLRDIDRRQQIAKAAGFPENLLNNVEWNKQTNEKFIAHLLDKTLEWETFSSEDNRWAIVEYLKATKNLGGGSHQRKLDYLIDSLISELQVTAAPPLTSKRVISFVNREQELSLFTNEISLVSRYAIHAPAGYGKTWLINRLGDEFTKKNWLVGRASLDRNTTLESMINEFLESIGTLEVAPEKFNITTTTKQFTSELKKQWEHQKKGIVLLLDLNELPTDIPILASVIREWFDLLIKDLLGLVYFSRGDNNFRIFIAGRFFKPSVKNLLRIDGKFEMYSLEPLKDRVLEQSVKQYLPDIIPDWQTDLSTNLFYYTGGHPRCFTDLLKLYSQEKMPDPAYFFSDKFSEIINLLNLEIDNAIKDVPEQVKQLLLSLSLYRYMSYEVMDEIIAFKEKIIEWSENSVELADRLTQTHLVSWDKTHYLLSDGITRRIIVRLLQFSQEHSPFFKKRCLIAKSIYLHRLSDKNEDRALANRWAIEYLYISLLSKAMEITSQEDRAKLRKEFWGNDEKTSLPLEGTDLFVCLDALVHERDPRRQIQSLQQMLSDSDEWEFQFMVNYFLRDNIFKIDWFRILLAKIEYFQLQYE